VNDPLAAASAAATASRGSDHDRGMYTDAKAGTRRGPCNKATLKAEGHMNRLALLHSSVILCLSLAIVVRGDEPKADDSPDAASPKVYDEQADARQQIDAAVGEARRDNKRVLVVFGGNWCGWCVKLHKLFDENADIGQLLLYEYATAWIDVDRLEKHADLAKQYSKLIDDHGVPYLAVLAADGTVLGTQDSGELEDGDQHDPEKVLAFLKNWAVAPPDAEKLLAEAQAIASATDKSVFVQCSTPTCGWCRRLDKFWSEQAALLDRDYVPVKIDVVRMKQGRDVAARLGFKQKSGVPWSAIVDAKGSVLATSDGAQGNIGYPAEPAEIAHFVSMLTKTARHNNSDDIARIEAALKEAGLKLHRSAAAAPVEPPGAAAGSGP
jgi:thioredoxin-related protein